MKRKILISCALILLIFPLLLKADDELDSIAINEIEKTMAIISSFTEAPDIHSKCAIVIDRESKEVIFGKRELERTPMASTTKIMTALIAIENANLDETVTISKMAARTGGSRLKLSAGDKITVKDLLYGLLLRSGNDAAVAIAEHVTGNLTEFANLMNEKAKNLGLINTHFETPHGLDAKEHYTTAYELALLADYALQNEIFANIVKTKVYNIIINGNTRKISNTNELLGNLEGIYGVKTGFTNGAGRCLVTSAKRGNIDIICVVLGANTKKDRTTDSIRLLEYTFHNFTKINIENRIKEEFEKWVNCYAATFKIEKGRKKSINFKIGEYTLKSYLVKKGEEQEIYINIKADFNKIAPIRENEKIGEIQVCKKDKIILKVDILSEEKIEKKKVWEYIVEFGKNYKYYLEKVIQ